jgi:phosphoserine phosphatase RsbU/P
VKPITLCIDPPTGPPSERTCEGEPLVFGRSPEAAVACSDSSMSRRHAQIGADDGGWFVEDLGARNGTFLNGRRIEGRVRLAPGDEVLMGATRVRFSGSPSTVRFTDEPGSSPFGQTIFRPVAELLPDAATTQGLALDPARLAARLEALNGFHRALGGAVGLDDLLALLLDQLFAALQPEEGVILLRRPDGTLRTAASRRQPGATGDLLVSQRLVTEVVEKNAAALVTDLEMDDRFASAQSLVSAGIRSILAAPFTDQGGCLGMVAIYSRTRVRRFGEEDLELLVSLASAAALRIRNVALAEAAAARLVQDRELALAHEIQMGMLPRVLPARPDVDLAARLIPARAVGGDLYDFCLTGDELWFIVADAAGKGVSAALFMAVTRTLFRAVVRDGAGVAAAAARMNAELARDNERQLFVTALVGRLQLGSGALTCCNAGHPPLLRLAANGDLQELAGGTGGIAFGVIEDAPYQEIQATLAPGDLLLGFTDGVTEAIDGTGALFSDPRLARTLTGCTGRPAHEAVAAVADAVTAFAAGVPQEDDITLLAIRWNPPARPGDRDVR